MTGSPALIDADECMHLALEAVKRTDHGTALAYLKEGASRYPENARMAYMLGAEYAQIGLYDRAEEELRRAVRTEPSLYMAVFQLGLLQMTQARMDDAIATWGGLDDLPQGHALRCFRDGLVALGGDRFEESRACLTTGMAINDFSPDLNRDMGILLANIPEASPVAASQGEEQRAPVWFSDYQNPGRYS